MRVDEEPQSPWGMEEKAVGTADLPPQGNCLRQAEIQKAPLSLQLYFFSRLYFWKVPRERVMIFKRKKTTTPSPKKVTLCTSKGSPHRRVAWLPSSIPSRQRRVGVSAKISLLSTAWGSYPNLLAALCSLPQLSESTKPIWNCLNPNTAPPPPHSSTSPTPKVRFFQS